MALSHRPVQPLTSDPASDLPGNLEESEMKKIFVGNLSYGASEDAVRSMFEAYGAVDSVSLVTDRDTGQPRGFAFVEMEQDAAEKAIEVW